MANRSAAPLRIVSTSVTVPPWVVRMAWAAFVVSVAIGPAASPAAAQAKYPPVRPLGSIVAVAKDPLPYITAIRPLSDGRVLALDTRSKRVVLFDSSLAHFVSVVDTTSGTAKAYGAAGGWLFPFSGDSSLFADYASLSFLVLDPAGKITRVMAAPRGPAGGLAYLGGTMVDPQGNVVSQQTAAAAARMGGAGARGASAPGLVVGGRLGGVGADTPPNTLITEEDSAVILRVSIETRQQVSTVWLHTGTYFSMTGVGGTGPLGNPLLTSLRNPIQLTDLWTLLPDGTVAVIREHDYHIDWVAPDGSVTSSPKIQHEWVHVTDSAKAAMLDSTRQADSLRMIVTKIRTDSIAAAAKKAGQTVTIQPNGSVMIQNGNGGFTVYGGATMGQYVSTDQLPDYLPPFETGADTLGAAIKADADGNVWIRVRLPKRPDGGAVYDIINRQGKLVDRIQVPGGTTLVGFAPGFAYVMSREGTGYKLARARIPARVPPG